MNVLIISQGQDTGGQGVRIAAAFRRHAPGWTVRSVAAGESFIKYPKDVEWDRGIVAEMYAAADVVHHKNGLGAYALLDGGQCKPTVLHHQGTRLRTNAGPVTREGESVGAVQLVSTVDLLADCPPAEWLPSPYDLDWIAETYKRRRRPGARVRIGHAPTNRRAKGTDAIRKVLNKLGQHHPIEVDLIEGVEWRVCLSRKGLCDIYIDQITNGYGNNSVEAMAMNVAVVGGWEDRSDLVRFVEATGGAPRFVEATAENLYERLEPLIVDAELREEWGLRGREYAEEFHSERAVVERLKRIYMDAPATRGPEFLEIVPDTAAQRQVVLA